MSYRSDWQSGLLNRNYFVLQELIASEYFETILSIDFLPFSLKKVAKVLVEQTPFRARERTVIKATTLRVDQDAAHENLFHMVATSRKHLSGVLQQLGMRIEDTVMWNYSPFEADLLLAYPDATHVFDAVDNWAAHSVYRKRKEELTKHYNTIARHADYIFTVSENLLELFGPQAVCIPNGVDDTLFQATAYQEDSSSKFIVGYHGNIQSRFDFALLSEVASRLPHIDFRIYGWVWKDVQDRADVVERENKNVHFYGRFDHTDLPSIMQEWNVAIVPHKNDRLTQSMNPMKVYEYLAAGKPIVATDIEGLGQLKDQVVTASDAESFSLAIQEALKDDTPEQKQARRSAVRKHTWEARVEEMLNTIGCN